MTQWIRIGIIGTVLGLLLGAAIDGVLTSLRTPVKKERIVISNNPTMILEGDQAVWKQITNRIESLSNSHIVLKLAGYGGDVVQEAYMVDVIKEAQKRGNTIEIDLVGPTISAFAMMSCYADVVTFKPGSSLLFHSMKSGGSRHINPEFQLVQKEQFAQCKSKGFLTPATIEAIIKSGKAVIVTKKDGHYSRKIVEDN